MTLSISLLVIRIVVGFMLFGHGAQKTLGWFGGYGFKGTSGWLGSLGFKPAWMWTLMAGLGELVGGLLFILGLLTPLAAVAIFASMFMAMLKIHWPNGLWVDKGGYEYPLVLIIISIVAAVFGPGAYAIDASIGLAFPLAVTIVLFVLAAIVDIIGVVVSNQQSAAQDSQQKAA
jgi:putative oxidoreductase